ncbi:MAG: TIGR01777 family protein [Deltaproteobacteria bacterium]|nr:TIGR01777 family protein [Deltaproteobacteria bacterium]
MRVAITGATGFVGRALSRALDERGDEVVAFTRDPEAAADRLEPEAVAVRWDPDDVVAIASSLAGVDAVVNLAGEPVVGKRWTAAQKARIHDSRVHGTRALVQALAQAEPRPSVFVSASAIGYYGTSGNQELDESAPSGTDFLAGVCRDWEAEALAAQDAGVRTVVIRVGVVLGADGGALPKLLLPFKLFVGGPAGDGQQWVSWIALDDLVGLVLFAIDQQRVRGVLNGTAPNPVTNRELSETIGHVLGRPSFLPAPSFGIKALLGEAATVVLDGQRVVPARALELGYGFRFVEPDAALRAILGK